MRSWVRIPDPPELENKHLVKGKIHKENRKPALERISGAIRR
jgi:hypothetical protein